MASFMVEEDNHGTYTLTISQGNTTIELDYLYGDELDRFAQLIKKIREE